MILYTVLLQASQSGGGYMWLIMLVLIGIVVIVAVKTSNKLEGIPIPLEQSNKVVNVKLTGGLIGLFTSSPLDDLNKSIERENANGWRVVQIIPSDSGNIFLYLFRLLLLLITLFLYTTVNGYYIVLEKK